MEQQEKTLTIRKRKEVPYFQVENNIFDMKCPLKPNDFVVYLYLTRLTNSARNVAYPSYETIASSCNLSRSSAIRSVKNLESMKLLELVKKEKGKSNSYYVNQYTDVFEFVCAFYGQIIDTGVRATLVSERYQCQKDTSVREIPASERYYSSITETPHQYHRDTTSSVRETLNKEIEIKKENKETIIKEDEEDKKKEKEIHQSLKNVEDCLTNILCFPKEWIQTVLQELQKQNLILTIKEIMLLTDVYDRISEQIDKINKFDIYFVTCYLEELRKERSKEFFNKIQKI